VHDKGREQLGVQNPVRPGRFPVENTMTAFPGIIMKRPRKRIAQRHLELRTKLWPDVGPEWLWSRHTYDGFTTLPRCMPLIMAIMDDMAKGQPVSMTYLELWCRSFEESFVVLSKPASTAFGAGFSGQRAERTWRGRLQILASLRFIDLKGGSAGPASYALIFNPYKVIAWHHANRTPGLREDRYNALMERASEVGDESLSQTPPAAEAHVTPAVAPTTAAPEAQQAVADTTILSAG
jgi:hypothetical protein